LRSYPHAPTRELLLGMYARYVAALSSDESEIDRRRLEKDEAFFKFLSNRALAIARLNYALNKSTEEVQLLIWKASNYANLSLILGAKYLAEEFMSKLACGLVSRHAELLETLKKVEVSQLVNKDVKYDELVYVVANVYKSLSYSASANINDMFSQAQASLSRPNVLPYVRNRHGNLIRMFEAVFSGNRDHLLEQVKFCHEFNSKWFKHAERRNRSESLLDLEALGVLQMARQKGLNPQSDSVYLPMPLLGN